MKIWLDDERDPKDYLEEKDYLEADWVWVQTAEEALELLRSKPVESISFDHDLGRGSSGYDVAKWIEEQAFLRTLKPIRWFIHSMNPVGYYNIMKAMLKADEYWTASAAKAAAKKDTVPGSQ